MAGAKMKFDTTTNLLLSQGNVLLWLAYTFSMENFVDEVFGQHFQIDYFHPPKGHCTMWNILPTKGCVWGCHRGHFAWFRVMWAFVNLPLMWKRHEIYIYIYSPWGILVSVGRKTMCKGDSIGLFWNHEAIVKVCVWVQSVVEQANEGLWEKLNSENKRHPKLALEEGKQCYSKTANKTSFCCPKPALITEEYGWK